LLDKKITGRPARVIADEMRWIAETVRDKAPWQMKLEFGLRTLSLIGEILYRQFGKRLTAPNVGWIMRILGVATKKYLYRAWRQNPVLVEKWQAKDYPALKAFESNLGGQRAGRFSLHGAGRQCHGRGVC